MRKALRGSLVAAIVCLMNAGSHGQSISKDGAIGGLQPRFLDVPVFGTEIRTRYYDQGQGEPVLLVHGGGLAASNGNSANIWSRNIPGLSRHFRVVAVDKLAAGMTGNPPADGLYNLQGETEHMYQFIRAMNLGPVHLVGQSRGAGLAWLLALKYPDVVKTLVLVNSGTASPVVGEEKHDRLMAQCPQELAERMKCEMRILSYPGNYPTTFDEEYFAAARYMVTRPKSLEAAAKMAANGGEPLRSEWPEWRKRLHARLKAEPALPMPVLLYWGKDDPQAPASGEGMALFDVLAGQHARARMIISNKAGHFHFREYPEEFNHNVTSFIEQWRSKPRAPARRPSAAVSTNGAVDGLEPKFVDVNGVRTRYYDEGKGEPLVLVHGGGLAAFNGNSANVWSRNIRGLSQRFRVLAVDKLAAGMTDNPPNGDGFSLEGETEHMYQFIQTMKLGPVHIVGQSRGAGLTFLLAMTHPEVVRTLVMVNSQTAAPEVGRSVRASMMQPCGGTDRLWAMKCEMLVLSFRPHFASTWDDEYFAAGQYMGGLPKAVAARAAMAAGAGEALRDRWNVETKQKLHERLKAGEVLPMPVLMYWGYNDPQATVDRAMALFETLAVHHPKVRLFWVNKAGHFVFREHPDEFNHNVMSFIEYWRGRSSGASARLR